MDPPSPAAAQDPSVSPSLSPATSGEPSVSPPPPPPPPAKKKQSAWVPPPPPPRPKKTQEQKKKEKPAPEKSGYEMTPKELDAWVQEDVRKQLKPKKPSPKEPVDPVGKKFYLSLMCLPKPPLMSDYDHSITKSWEKKSNRRYNQVPQLSEQPKQSVPPLVVLSKEDEATAEFVKETNLTKAQLLGQEKIPGSPRGRKKAICTGGTSDVARVD